MVDYGSEIVTVLVFIYNISAMKKTLTIGLILSAALVLAGCATPTTSTHAPTIDSEESFLVNMLSHHQEAIESADIVWGKSTNVEVRKLAEGIVKTQEKEVNNMQDWLANWYSGSTMKIDYMDMMPAISELNTPELDRTFLEGMIDHHK